MTDIATIYQGAQQLINQLISREADLQGHYLTGAMNESLTGTVSQQGRNTDVLEGFAAYYTEYVNQGVPAASASMKQFPFLVRYFQQRGLEEKEAKGAAAATIKVWMKEGMSTQASKRFSQTGARQHFVENVFVGHADKIDGFMSDNFDQSVTDEFHQSKDETI